jgi:hypothetical protein
MSNTGISRSQNKSLLPFVDMLSRHTGGNPIRVKQSVSRSEMHTSLLSLAPKVRFLFRVKAHSFGRLPKFR